MDFGVSEHFNVSNSKSQHETILHFGVSKHSMCPIASRMNPFSTSCSGVVRCDVEWFGIGVALAWRPRKQGALEERDLEKRTSLEGKEPSTGSAYERPWEGVTN